MSLITIMPSGKTIEVAEGTTLLAAILAAEVNLTHNCEGNVLCGTCHIFVQEGRKVCQRSLVKKREARFHCRRSSKSRLACQAKVLGTRISRSSY